MPVVQDGGGAVVSAVSASAKSPTGLRRSSLPLADRAPGARRSPSMLSPKMAMVPEYAPTECDNGASSGNQLTPGDSCPLMSSDESDSGSPNSRRMFAFPNIHRLSIGECKASAKNWKADRWSPSAVVSSSSFTAGGRGLNDVPSAKKSSASSNVYGGGGGERRKLTSNAMPPAPSATTRRRQRHNDEDDKRRRGAAAGPKMSLAEQSFLSSPSSHVYQRIKTYSLKGRDKQLVDCGFSYRKQPGEEDDVDDEQTTTNQELMSDQTEEEEAMIQMTKAKGRRATCPAIWISRAESFTSTVFTCRLWILGEFQVGKTALAGQLVKELQAEHEDACLTASIDSSHSMHVSFLLNSFEVQLHIIELQSIVELDVREMDRSALDLYCVVYSMTSASSYKVATDLLFQLSQETSRQTAKQRNLIIVGNKNDLQRQRKVKETKGQLLAKIYRCRCVELSATLAINLERLLEELMRLIQARLKAEQRLARQAYDQATLQPDTQGLPEGLLGRIRTRTRRLARSCENLLQRLASG